MVTSLQKTGAIGEGLVASKCICPGCKKKDTFKRLPTNFKCADIICDFCGFLSQVKTMNVSNHEVIPKTCLGAAWQVQKDRMDSGIYFPLYLVLIAKNKKSIFYLSADHQHEGIFAKRKPLSSNAKRAGWTGFYYNFSELLPNAFVRIF